ncbi:GNAT family N-acetyltransferase [Kibdelosporangium persicum]|uniref:Acetyltransferase n=1 Tax=Kibdelosporangium persicum TaxID=2698649 RepID=A0ABX2F7G7_9PSEU|nr:GNAT family N-acetyltransferase [Kibdelosporangium persicum]NRN67301.1 putative acetyltransferase [Kibdelosporangium persicum]
MEARAYETAAEFREAAWPVLAADPIRNTILLTVTTNPLPGALLLTLHDNGKLIGAVIRTDPYPLVVSAMPAEAAAFTARTVHEVLPDLPGAMGPVDRVEAFVDAWTKITGASATRVLAVRMYELGELVPPVAAGSPRHAEEKDAPLLMDWFAKFALDTRPAGSKLPPVEPMVKATLAPGAGGILWEVDATPVSLAVANGPAEGVARIAPVYTPPEHRGHGYASAVTAAAAQWALDQGARHVLINTDLANATTNHIYPAIGFRPLDDTAEYRF